MRPREIIIKRAKRTPTLSDDLAALRSRRQSKHATAQILARVADRLFALSVPKVRERL